MGRSVGAYKNALPDRHLAVDRLVRHCWHGDCSLKVEREGWLSYVARYGKRAKTGKALQIIANHFDSMQRKPCMASTHF